MESSTTDSAGGAHVGSWSALEALEGSLARFADHAQRSVERASRGLRRFQAAVEQRRRQAERSVDAARAAYEECDVEEDDVDYYSSQLQAAEEELEEAERRCDEFERAAEVFHGQVRTFHGMVKDTVPAARHFLREKIGLLHEIHAVPLEGVTPAAATIRASSRLKSPAENTGHQATEASDGFSGCPLPRGFVWVPLGDIDLGGELRNVLSPSAFQKVPYDVMRRGLERFRAEILPQVRKNVAAATSDYFGRQDHTAGADYEHGLQRIYDAFFGSSDYIYLVRGRDQAKFTVQSGRHRIKVALDLGWRAIPVQVKDLKGKARHE
jgi:hypothetical protein